MESIGVTSDEKPLQQKGSWRERFFWAFFAVGVPSFMWLYFPDNASSFSESVFAAVSLGGVAGILAALFGQRVVDFFFNLPW
jgi:hypothetical protein